MYINYKSFVTDVQEYDQQGINILNFDHLRLGNFWTKYLNDLKKK